MNGDRLSLGSYAAVAAVIAATAFVAGALAPGAGGIVAGGGSLLWVAYNVRRFGRV